MSDTKLFAFAVFLTICCLQVECGRRHRFVCPPSEDIIPCECQEEPAPLVKCLGMHSLEEVKEALVSRFPQSLPSLQISNSDILALPDHALGNISVSKLVVKGGNLREIDEDAFVGQENLQFLELNNDRLFDVPGPALNKLSRLRTLSLAENLLIRLEDDSFVGLDGLKSLVLRNNRITLIEKHAFPDTLEFLSLQDNHLTTLNDTLINLSRLDWLFLGNNRLTSIEGQFRGLENLQILSLQNNLISDLLDNLKDLRHLKVLNLESNNLYNLGDSLTGLKSLTSLKLSSNYLLELGNRAFSGVPLLQGLDISNNQLFDLDRSLRHLSQLVHLNLSNNELENLSYKNFKGLSHLEDLDLSHNKLTSTVAIKWLTRLTKLNLKNNRLSSLHPGLKSLRHLTSLDVSYNRLTFLFGNHLRHNKHLEEMNIAGNPWLCSDALTSVLNDLESRLVHIKGKPSACYLMSNNL